ncbi:MAG: hypothetical protein GF375_04180, partial [Candidatus Omnitrophica bacterium]|nr:hypothetical protein [Candidatus Omnitrophota bacterium]
MYKKIFFLLVILSVLFFFWGNIAGFGICYYIENRLGGECELKNVRFLLTGLELNNLFYRDNDLKFAAENLGIEVGFVGFLRPYLSRVYIHGGKFFPGNIEALKKKLFSPSGDSKEAGSPVSLNRSPTDVEVKKILLSYNLKKEPVLECTLSFYGRLGEEGFLLEDLKVSGGSINTAFLKAKGLKIEKVSQDSY